MTETDEIIERFIEAFCQLAKANCLTGIWDTRRFQECKKPLEGVDAAYIYKTEKLARKNAELRSVRKTQIDVAFENLLDLAKSL